MDVLLDILAIEFALSVVSSAFRGLQKCCLKSVDDSWKSSKKAQAGQLSCLHFFFSKFFFSKLASFGAVFLLPPLITNVMPEKDLPLPQE